MLRICATPFGMTEIRDEVRAWLRQVLEQTGMSATRLAREIGTSTTTLTRVLNDPNYTGVLSHRTIAAITRVTGQAGPNTAVTTARNAPGELDGLHLPPETGDLRVDDAVRYLCQAEASLAPWRLNTLALESLGYLPGDIMMVDMNAVAESGDIVVAQVYSQKTTTFSGTTPSPS